MKTRKSNSYVKTGMYLLIGALAGGVLGAGAYMILSSWGQGFEGTHPIIWTVRKRPEMASCMPALSLLSVWCTTASGRFVM
ncbi:hypothetical protein [Lachnoclostridium sp. An131]|uniref:hypothetical protein n=1 Tax=Lachnoclostridium sp. An131 TaxID=1965555 RepID=UPI001FA8D4B5|nr:hypothetical protein [Lachnoclostridium sp. An131]